MISVGHGESECAIVITDNMLNFLGVPHGGLLFSLADAALSAASNSDHRPSYAINVSGSFLAKVRTGDKIIAKAKRVHQSHKTALYEIEVLHDANVIAKFHGTVYKSKS